MNTHPSLRAYLAGIFLPTLVLPMILTLFIVLRIVLQWPVPIEKAIIFPMAVVPSLFGLWNMLFLASHEHLRQPIGLHGAVLPLLMMPTGAWVGTGLGVLQLGQNGVTWFHVCSVPYVWIVCGLLAGMAAYYLVWKYVVGYLNRVLGIA